MTDFGRYDPRKAKKHSEVLIKILFRIIECTPMGGATQDDLRDTYQQVKMSAPHDRTIKRIINDLNEFFLRWEEDGDLRLPIRSGPNFCQSATQDSSPVILSLRKGGVRRYFFAREISEGLKSEEIQASMLALSLYPQQKNLMNEQFQALMKLVGENAFSRKSRWRQMQADMERHVYVSGYSTEPLQEINRYMVRILDAIRRQKLIQLDYVRNYDGELTTGRRVAPYGMIYRLSVWYLTGLDQSVQELRLFRLDQIKRMNIVENSVYQIPVTFSLKEHYRHSWGVWGENGEKPEKVVLRVEPGMAEKFLNTRYHESQSIRKEADGSAIVTMQITGARAMLPWLMTWCGTVEVLEPDWMREALLMNARSIVGMYESSKFGEELL